MSNILVAYFSATGQTARAANTLAEALNADLYEIRAAHPYTEADLNWTNKQARSTVESQDRTARPALADRDCPVQDHDVVFVGFPIWWYTAPAVIRTFLETYNFAGKRVILFATSGGSGLGSTASQLQECCPGAEIENGRVLHESSSSAQALQKWAHKLGVI